MSTRPLIRVREVMKPHFDMVDGMATVASALEAMRHVDTKTLIVKPRSDNDELGIVVISDIARKVLAKDRAFAASELTYDPRREDPFVVRPAYEYTHASNNYHAARRYVNLIDDGAVRTFI